VSEREREGGRGRERERERERGKRMKEGFKWQAHGTRKA